MKRVLIVCSGNVLQPFVNDQALSLLSQGVQIDFFYIKGRGIWGYFKNRKQLLKKILTYKPNIIHAHFGLSGLLSNLQRSVPVVTTYHGSDINIKTVFLLSRISILLSSQNIFVSKVLAEKAGVSRSYSIIPCGVDTHLFVDLGKNASRYKLNLPQDRELVLFGGVFNNSIKNFSLAQNAIHDNIDVDIVELKGYSREQVVLLMNSVDLLILTSHSEGSPQVIKEAMACNCPIVSTDVGDVRWVIGDTEGCFICSYDPSDVARKIELALEFARTKGRTNGRQRIIELGLDSDSVAKQLVEVYKKALR